jgi:polyphosphate glucokinase
VPLKRGRTDAHRGAGLARHGKKKWRRHVADVVTRLIADDTVIGGGNAAKLDALPPHSRIGENANAFLGEFQLWEKNVALPQVGARSKQQA